MDDKDLAEYLEMETEELCDLADEGDETAQLVLQAEFMNEIYKEEPADKPVFCMFPPSENEERVKI